MNSQKSLRRELCHSSAKAILLSVLLISLPGIFCDVLHGQSQGDAVAKVAPLPRAGSSDVSQAGESEEDAPSDGKKQEAVPDNVVIQRDVSYLPADRKEKADLYMPAKILPGTRMPAVVIIHGGGFNDGNKAKWDDGKKEYTTRGREYNFGINLAQHGYLGMSIDYKLRKKPGQVTWPQCLHDAKTAVRWLRANAERLHVDPDRIGAMGGSAGGNLATMLALTRPQDGLEPEEPYGEYPSTVRCAVDLYGAVDLINYHDVKMFARTRAEDPGIYHKASPLSYVRKDEPPVLILHGTMDKVVNVSQSETLSAAMDKAGAPHELVIIPGAPHTFDLQSFIDLRPKAFGFFDKCLKN